MNIFMFPQIWDLADPEGKGFLDKQVYKHTHTEQVEGLGPEPRRQGDLCTSFLVIAVDKYY